MAWNTVVGDMADSRTLVSDPWPTGYGLTTGVTNPLFGGFPTLSFTSGLSHVGGHRQNGSSGPQGQFNFQRYRLLFARQPRFQIRLRACLGHLRQFINGDTQGALEFADLQNFLQGFPDSGKYHHRRY